MKKITNVKAMNVSKLKQQYLGTYSGLMQMVKRRPGFGAAVGGVLLVLVAIVLWQAPWRADSGAGGQAARQHKEQLQSQVDTEIGAPRSGRDPASQHQTSLAEAASQPTGAGTRTDTPAAGVEDEHAEHAHMHGHHGAH